MTCNHSLCIFLLVDVLLPSPVLNYANIVYFLWQLSFDWRKILEVLILGQFVVEKVFLSFCVNIGPCKRHCCILTSLFSRD